MNPTSRSAHQGVKAAQLCNCNLSSYSNFSAAFSCGVKENLCPDRLPSPTLMPALTPVSLSTIAPSPSNAPSFTPTSNIPPVDDQGNFFNIREYSVLVTSAGIEVSSILQQRSFDPAVFAVASCLIIILVAGFVYFSRWDASDRHAVSKQPIAVDEASQNYPLIYRKSLNAALPELSSGNAAFNEACGWLPTIFRAILCCIPSSERSTRLVNGMEIPRFLDALRRYHPWVGFFTGVSRVRTRALRFLPTFKYILTSIFLSTILFDFYYPASSCADFNKNPLACVTAPAKLPYGESLCVYSSSSGVCGLRPPLRSTSFLLAVALVTFSIMIPYNILFYSVLINVCSKHPQSLLWFGDEVIELEKPLNGAIVDDRVNRLQEVLQDRHSLESLDGVKFALQKLGLMHSASGELQLTLISSLRFKDVPACIRYTIERSLKDAQRIIRIMDSMSGVSRKNSYLTQRFTMKRFNPILRVSLYRYFGHSACDLPESIHPAIWILGWLYVVVSILFFVVWIIQWGSAHNQNDIIFSWGLNFILTDLNEVLIFSVVRIFFINVVAINFIQPYLAAFKVYLRDVEERPTASGIYQCIDPALIAADISGVLDLGAISDEDIYDFHTGKFSKTEEFKGYSECDPCDVTFVL